MTSKKDIKNKIVERVEKSEVAQKTTVKTILQKHHKKVKGTKKHKCLQQL